MEFSRRNPRNTIRCICDYNLFHNLYVKTYSSRYIPRIFRVSFSKHPVMDTGSLN